jgi:hypothetical protein
MNLSVIFCAFGSKRIATFIYSAKHRVCYRSCSLEVAVTEIIGEAIDRRIIT